MSDSQTSNARSDAEPETRRRNWRLFFMIMTVGIALAATLSRIEYLPEAYQNLVFFTAAGLAMGFVPSQFKDFQRRDRIGMMAGGVAITTFVAATSDHIITAWIVSASAALTAIVVLALRWSQPPELKPGLRREALR